MGNLRFLLVAISATLLLTGCVNSSNPAGEPETAAPVSYGDLVRARNEEFALCMRDRGWNVHADPVSLGVEFSCANDEQCAALRADNVICDDLHPAVYPSDLSISVEQAETYVAALMMASECLVENGFTISDPPSQQSLVEAVQNWDNVWDPWSELLDNSPGGDGSEFFRAINLCPQPLLQDFI